MGEYWIARKGEKQGPYPEEQVRRNYASGRVLPTDLVWTDGMADWKVASQVFGPVPPRPVPPPAPASATPYRPPAAVVRDEGDAGSGDEVVYAGFWVRFGALIIDNVIVYAATIAITALAMFAVASIGSTEMVGIASVGGWLAFFVGAFFYFTLMESDERGATLGKRAFKLRVVTVDGHERIGYGRAVGRFFAHGISSLILYIGFLIQPFMPRKQALHDMICGTAVVARGQASSVLVGVTIVLGLLAPIGLIAAIAIPAYQDYSVRAKVSEALIAASPAQSAVAAYVAERQTVPKSLAEAGVDIPSTSRVRDITINPRNATLTVTLAFSPLAGKRIQLVPQRADGQITGWQCRRGTVASKYLPASCRSS